MNRLIETSRILAAWAAFVLAAPGIVQADSFDSRDGVDGFRARMEKWVEARTVLSKERSDWAVEKQFLEATRDMLQRERDVLREDIEELEAAQSGADQERRELVLLRAEFQQSTLSLEDKIADLEAQVMRLVPRLPDPLQRRLDPLLVQIPSDPESTRVALGQRLINVLGLLAQAEKWNGTANFVGETRAVAMAGGDKILVRTLYWGLAQAVFVDAQGRTAGVGRPGDEGWVFEDVEDLTPDAKLLLDIYEGNVDTIAFVPIPVEVR